MPDLGIGELLIIAVVIMLLFGAKRMPDAARSLGRSLRIFKAETKGLRDDDRAEPQRLDSGQPYAAGDGAATYSPQPSSAQQPPYAAPRPPQEHGEHR